MENKVKVGLVFIYSFLPTYSCPPISRSSCTHNFILLSKPEDNNTDDGKQIKRQEERETVCGWESVKREEGKVNQRKGRRKREEEVSEIWTANIKKEYRKRCQVGS